MGIPDDGMKMCCRQRERRLKSRNKRCTRRAKEQRGVFPAACVAACFKNRKHFAKAAWQTKIVIPPFKAANAERRSGCFQSMVKYGVSVNEIPYFFLSSRRKQCLWRIRFTGGVCVIREQTKLRIEVSKEAAREEKCRTEALAKILARVLAEQSTCPVKGKQPENRSVRTL